MHSFSESSSYFEVSIPVFSSRAARLNSAEGRFLCVAAFLGLILFLPFIVVFKIVKSLFRCIGVLLALSFFVLSLGISVPIREFFIRRVSALGKDAVDWILFPFAIITCGFRLLLASIILPSFFLPR